MENGELRNERESSISRKKTWRSTVKQRAGNVMTALLVKDGFVDGRDNFSVLKEFKR